MTIKLLIASENNGVIAPAGSTAAQDAFRVAMNSRTRALAGNGVYVLDADGLITNGGSPARIQPAYVTTADGIHPSVAGYQAIGAQFQAILTTILNGR